MSDSPIHIDEEEPNKQLLNPNTLTKQKDGQKCLLVHMQPGITKLNLTTFYFSSLLTIAFFTFINASAPFVLSTYLRLPQKEQGKAAGDLAFYNEIVVLLSSFVWGASSDKVGRKIVYFLGFLLIACGIIAYPFARTFWILLIFRLIFALGAGAVATSLTAVLGDYVIEKDRGKASAMMGLMSGAGAIFSALILLKLPNWLHSVVEEQIAGYITYGAIGIIAIIGSLFCVIGLHGKITNVKQKESIRNIITEGLLSAKNPLVLLSYLASFVARGDSVIITTFITLWVSQVMQSRGHSNADALSRAGLISGICQTVALCVAPIAGICADKIHVIGTLIIGSLLASIGYISISLVNDVTGGWVYLPIVLIGAGEITVIILAQVLVTKAAPKHVRGSVSGVYSFCGAVGILISTKLGGILYDHWIQAGPFIFVGIFNVILAFAAILYWIYETIKHSQSQNSNKQQNNSTEDLNFE